MPLYEEKPIREESERKRVEQWLKKFLERTREKREKVPVKKEEKKDTSIFRGKESLPMKEFTWKFRKASPFIPGAGGAIYSEKERLGLANKVREVAKKKFGSQYYLGKDKCSQIIKEFEKEKWRAKTGAEKQKIDRQIRVLRRELLGK